MENFLNHTAYRALRETIKIYSNFASLYTEPVDRAEGTILYAPKLRSENASSPAI